MRVGGAHELPTLEPVPDARDERLALGGSVQARMHEPVLLREPLREADQKHAQEERRAGQGAVGDLLERLGVGLGIVDGDARVHRVSAPLQDARQKPLARLPGVRVGALEEFQRERKQRRGEDVRARAPHVQHPRLVRHRRVPRVRAPRRGVDAEIAQSGSQGSHHLRPHALDALPRHQRVPLEHGLRRRDHERLLVDVGAANRDGGAGPLGRRVHLVPRTGRHRERRERLRARGTGAAPPVGSRRRAPRAGDRPRRRARGGAALEPERDLRGFVHPERVRLLVRARDRGRGRGRRSRRAAGGARRRRVAVRGRRRTRGRARGRLAHAGRGGRPRRGGEGGGRNGKRLRANNAIRSTRSATRSTATPGASGARAGPTREGADPDRSARVRARVERARRGSRDARVRVCGPIRARPKLGEWTVQDTPHDSRKTRAPNRRSCVRHATRGNLRERRRDRGFPARSVRGTRANAKSIGGLKGGAEQMEDSLGSARRVHHIMRRKVRRARAIAPSRAPLPSAALVPFAASRVIPTPAEARS